MRILVLEPYFGGSHRAFLEGLARNLDFEFDFFTLPARKWKWRMRFSAPFFVEQLRDKRVPDCILCSTFVDVATLKGLLPARFKDVAILTYFHENQFAYPVQVNDERDFHFGLTNFTTALASDRLAFNSSYNLESFLAGCREFLKKVPDMAEWRQVDHEGLIRAKTTVLPPGLDFADIDREPEQARRAVPVIVWNHRWEHDKDPEFFFSTLAGLAGNGVDFGLIVLGQAFQRQPKVFVEAQQELAARIIHFGFAKSRADYLRLLKQGDIVVSTARHEFYGISVLEAVRAGCRPLLPGRLAYPELFDKEFLYQDQEFGATLKKLLAHPARLDKDRARNLTRSFSWIELGERYRSWLAGA